MTRSLWCTSCHHQYAQHGSSQFPTVWLCWECYRDFLGGLYETGFADGNPLVFAFFETVTVWTKGEGDSWRAHQVRIKYQNANSA